MVVGRGGGGEVVLLYFSAALPKQQPLPAIGYNGPLFLSSIKKISPLGIADRFFLVNLVGHVKMH